MLYLDNPTGFVTAVVQDKEGNVVRKIEEHNLLLESLGNVLAWLFADPLNHTNLAITKVGFGINTAAPQITNEVLSESKVVKNLEGYTLLGNKVTYSWELDYSEGNNLGDDIAEAGLYTTSGILVARKLFTPAITKTSEFKFSGTWTIHLPVSEAQGVSSEDVFEYGIEYYDPTDSPENTVYHS